MIICDRYDFFQIIDWHGRVRLCCWLKDGVIGSLMEKSVKELWHGERAKKIHEKLSCFDYSNCVLDYCSYLSTKTIDMHLKDIGEIPDLPDRVLLAFEHTCNYHCRYCRRDNEHVNEEMEEGYRIIERRLAEVLPYVHEIAANGLGELFASPHTLNLLSNWKPIQDGRKKFVELETNGSLFNKENWQKIENVGQYHLHVAVTVNSFDNNTYQSLSGTNLPVDQVIDNLHYIKELRKKGIVNYFEIATVYQERNFRTLPEFVRKCLEEFEADYIRLRPVNLHNIYSREEEWFDDIRGVYHPYHQEFLELMKHPILQHPKVHDWGGGLPSSTGKHPAVTRLNECQRLLQRENKKNEIIESIIDSPHIYTRKIKKIMEMTCQDNVLIYGAGIVGKVLWNALHNDIKKVDFLDRFMNERKYQGAQIINPQEKIYSENNESAVVVVTPLGDTDEIIQYLKEIGFKHVYSVVELMKDE